MIMPKNYLRNDARIGGASIGSHIHLYTDKLRSEYSMNPEDISGNLKELVSLRVLNDSAGHYVETTSELQSDALKSLLR
jgi:hypothetical protein